MKTIEQLEAEYAAAQVAWASAWDAREAAWVAWETALEATRKAEDAWVVADAALDATRAAAREALEKAKSEMQT